LAHTALARTYRPRSFGEVATQEHVSETLRRAVASGRVGHAYLFCGPRGVGKTTLARVLAMALNCPARSAEGEPCGECESCRKIWAGGTALDVVEIDAATNRGVEDARNLRERAMYSPSTEESHKIYIVDEAHMLTREAWNALLKVLEEPPPRVIFIFATTEPQKIQQMAAPILSRCQRFDFRRIGDGDIVDRLRTVLAREGVAAPEDALRLVARRADGGMRDALSLLDQVLALTGGEVSAESTRRVLGLVEDERYVEVMGVLRDRRPELIFPFVEGLLDEGYDLVEFHQGLVDSLRALLQLRLDPGSRPQILESVRGDFVELSTSFSPGDLVRMLALAAELESGGSLRRTAHPRVLLELLLLRLAYLDRTVELEGLIRALGGAPPPPLPPPPAGSGAPPARGGASGDPSTTAGGSAPAPSASPRGDEGPIPETFPTASPAAASTRSAPPSPTSGVARPEDASRRPGEPAVPPGGIHRREGAGEPWDRFGAAGVAAGGAEPGDGPSPRSGPRPGEGEGRRKPVSQDGKPPPMDWSGMLDARPPESRERITHASVRDDRLRELLSREPLLRHAVEALDLELMD
jgi:DNA polymerase III subunit gamma/tau